MQAHEFVKKWQPGAPANELNERAGAQTHFIDLCRVLGVPEPADPENYCFERGVTKTGSASVDGKFRKDGFADVWMRGHFAWEYKAPGKSLEGALKQLMMYALPLENPPLLVVSDRLAIEVHTHFTGTPSERHRFALEEITDPAVQHKLRALWQEPERYKPKRTNREITEEAARTFAGTAERLRAAGVPPPQASHFLTQCVFCFFAEDVGLLPGRLFERLVGVAVPPATLRAQLQALFVAMKDGGLFGVDAVPWFNGGLFASIDVPPLAEPDVAALKAASRLDWSAIDPSILGTLFERGLDPAKRAQLGAHYTDPATILRLVEPVVQRPLLAEWAGEKQRIEAALSKSKKHNDKVWRDAQAVFVGFLEKLKAYKVLDPACGSGNFLYLSLKALKDIEHQVNLEAEALGLQRQHDVTGPHNVLGIELNEYAAELARVTVWIGELQWRIQRGYGFRTNPVLDPLDHIECRDAVMGSNGKEAEWPAVDAVVGNPPFVGDKKMRGELGDAYTEALRAAYKGRVPGGADLVCYWFERARAEIEAGRLKRAGLVATQAIRNGKSRRVLDRTCSTSRLFDAWRDQPWVNEGAAVRVSMVSFGSSAQQARLDGLDVAEIYPDLTAREVNASGVDLTTAVPLVSNGSSSFQGVIPRAEVQKKRKLVLGLPDASFNLDGPRAREILRLPATPAGQPQSEVVFPYWIADDITTRPLDRFIVNFGDRTEAQAALHEEAFAAIANVRLHRLEMEPGKDRTNWWQLARWRPAMFRQLHVIPRFISIPRVSKFHLCAWTHNIVVPDSRLAVVSRADDANFGMLHCRAHEVWAIRTGSRHGVGNDPTYNPTTCFETFPFPAGLTPADTAHQRTEPLPSGALIPADLPEPQRTHAAAIAEAAFRLNALRENWLNPPEWTERVPEVVPLGMSTSPYPDRIVAKAGHEAELAKRTLTNLYNQRPAWLAQAHAALDAAVAAAYGWADYTAAMPDEEILRRLLALNRERSATEAAAVAKAVKPQND
ncbi:MAG: class I SAM-dependent DNA methyltransferase [Burkholderiales bacterium]|nr:class I SAM-dependent DNA methyltransferase [Burkholderiales bacterium]